MFDMYDLQHLSRSGPEHWALIGHDPRWVRVLAGSWRLIGQSVRYLFLIGQFRPADSQINQQERRTSDSRRDLASVAAASYSTNPEPPAELWTFNPGLNGRRGPEELLCGEVCQIQEVSFSFILKLQSDLCYRDIWVNQDEAQSDRNTSQNKDLLFNVLFGLSSCPALSSGFWNDVNGELWKQKHQLSVTFAPDDQQVTSRAHLVSNPDVSVCSLVRCRVPVLTVHTTASSRMGEFITDEKHRLPESLSRIHEKNDSVIRIIWIIQCCWLTCDISCMKPWSCVVTQWFVL